MSWLAPDGKVFRKLDIDVVEYYFSEDDFERELNMEHSRVIINRRPYPWGAVVRKEDPRRFREEYRAEVDKILENPRYGGFIQVSFPRDTDNERV